MKFAFTELTNVIPAVYHSACLGVSAAAKLSDFDLGKPLKMAANDNFILCAAGDDMEGFLGAVDPVTFNNGFAFGSVLRATPKLRVKGKVAVGSTDAAVGSLLVAAAPSAVGTKDLLPLVQVGTPVLDKWRCITIISGTGAAGSVILMERI